MTRVHRAVNLTSPGGTPWPAPNWAGGRKIVLSIFVPFKGSFEVLRPCSLLDITAAGLFSHGVHVPPLPYSLSSCSLDEYVDLDRSTSNWTDGGCRRQKSPSWQGNTYCPMTNSNWIHTGTFRLNLRPRIHFKLSEN